MAQVFISYVQEDSPIALEIARGIEASGYSTWYYERDHVPGPGYLLQTGEAIDSAEAVALIISESSVESNQVTSEVVRAHENSKPFIPLLYGISHAEFQERAPIWRQALVSSSSIAIADGVARRIADGLSAFGIEPELSQKLYSPGTAFVGRKHETGELVTALEDVLRGSGRLVMLVGEPGIGKTRTAQELAEIAERRGVQVLWGRCYEEEGTPPYWPWVQVIRTYVRENEADILQSQMGVGAADIAEVVQEVREKLPGLEPRPALEPQQARFRLFDSVATFLRRSSQSQPIMLVLDDLHWADTPSLLLLEHLAHQMEQSKLLVVGTYRDVELNRQHPLHETLGGLGRERLFHRVLLRGLSHDDVGSLMQTTLGDTPPAATVGSVFARTEGNPFFVTEIARVLLEEGGTDSVSEIRIPEGVREAIDRRLNRLSDRCNQVLTSASVIGREFEFDTLERVMDELSEDEVLDAVEEAVGARLVEETSRGSERYQFSHALINQTLSEELSTRRRVRLHAKIAQELEQLYGDDAEAHVAELAHHFAQAETMLGIEKMVRYSIMAGERAISANAYEEALVQFQRALSAREGSSSSTDVGQGVDAEMATILFGLGRAQTATFARAQAQEAIDTLRRAFDAFVDLGYIENAVDAATYVHGFLSYSSGTADMAARALDLVPPDSIEAGYILSRYGPALSWENKDYEGAQENLERAVEIARREGDKFLEVRALVYIAQMHFAQEHYREAVEIFLPVIELAQSLDELDTLARARIWCTRALLAMGDGNATQIHATAGLEVAERLHNSFSLAQTLSTNANLAALKGEWKIAQEFITRAVAELPRDTSTLAVGALLNVQVGNLEESSEYIKQVLEVVPDVPVGAGIEHAFAAATISLFARIKGTTELLDVAESAAREALSSPSIPNLDISTARVGLALIAIQRIDSESAKYQYSILESRRGTQLFSVICYDRLLGLLAQTMGNLDDAQAHFEDALVFCRKAGYSTELAWSLCDYADMLLERNDEGDRQKAMQLLDESLAISTELGMRPLMERVLSRREILKA